MRRNGKMMLCVRCGGETIRRAGAQLYCERCSAIRVEESRNPPEIMVGMDMPCEICQTIIVKTAPRTRYCKPCAKQRRRETNKAHDRRRYRDDRREKVLEYNASQQRKRTARRKGGEKE